MTSFIDREGVVSPKQWRELAKPRFEPLRRRLEFRVSDLAVYTETFWPENWNLARGKSRISGSLAGKVTLNGPLTMPGGTADIKARQLIF